MEKETDMLKACRLFHGITQEQLTEQILPLGHFADYHKEQFLITPQQRVDKIGIVVSGKIHILHIFANGNHSLMSVISSGELVGADLAGTPTRISPYHALAVSDVRVFYLPANAILFAGTMPDELRLKLLQQLLSIISNENMKKEYRLAILSRNGLRDRIITYLTMQAQRRGENCFEIPFSREEMASFLCVNRSALSHELSLLQQEGWISFRKNRFMLHRYEDD